MAVGVSSAEHKPSKRTELVRVDADFLPVIKLMRLVAYSDDLLARLLSAFDDEDPVLVDDGGESELVVLKKRIKKLEHMAFLHYERLALEERRMNELKARFNAISDKAHLRLTQSRYDIEHECSEDCKNIRG